MTREEMIEHLTLDAEYFPFEQLRQYKSFKAQEPHISFDFDLKQDYLSFFRDVRELCEILLDANPTFEDADLWQEAIAEIDKLFSEV